MRLTLRTLLAYLDDTLEPSQAKMIGQKVAESDTAQELIARIKQVTRRRRLTTPPESGPGGKIDANTIADYLDNAVTSEQLAEVEQICLASDVHLAEVAACHQILTLVLGEPALVPPTAKQRMYGLVKGPEAIPFRKPPAHSEHDHDVIDDSKEIDETLRLGLPLLRRKGSWSHRLLLLGGGALVASLLVFAIWQVLNPPGQKVETLAQNGGKEKPVDQPPIKEKEPEQVDKKDSGKKGDEPADKKDTDKKGSDKKEANEKNPKEKEPVREGPEFPKFEPASDRQSYVGNFLATEEKSILLQAPADRSEWKRLRLQKPEVYSGRPLVSLPGSRSLVEMKSGVRLTLWGYLPELWPFPPLLESAVEVHYNDQVDLDLTLHRGRLLLLNTRADRPVRIRLRFENPTNPEAKEYFDIALLEKGSELLVDRWSLFPYTEPFFKDPKNGNRTGPTAQMGMVAMAGELYLKSNDLTFRLEAPPRPGSSVVAWNSFKGLMGPHRMEKLPETVSTNPPLPPGVDDRTRFKVLNARDELSSDMAGKNVDVALTEAIKSPNEYKRRLAVRCYGALDDLPNLVDALAQEQFRDVRQDAIATLQFWIGSARDAEYKLYDLLRSKYNFSVGQAGIIMDLLHNTYYSPQAVSRPETYETLIQYLNHDVLIVRELAAWHLFRLVPAGRDILYSAVADAAVRQNAQAAWRKLIPPGKLPPQPPVK